MAKRAKSKGKSEIRADDGSYAPGTSGGNGGYRPGAGRKPNIVKKVLEEVLNAPLESGKTLVEEARATLVDAVRDRVKDRKGNVHVPKSAVAAAINILDRQFGRAKVSVEIDTSNGGLLKHVADLADAAKSSED